MKTRTNHWSVQVPPALMERIDAEVKHGQKAARQIWIDLALTTWVRERTFRTYVMQERKGRRRVRRGTVALPAVTDSAVNDGSDSSPSPSSSVSPPSPEQLEAQLMTAAMEQVLAGQLKASTIVGLLMANSSVKKERVRTEANRRAEEKHALQVAKMRSEIKTRVEEKTEGGTKALSREDVYDLVDAVMRGTA